MLLNKKEKLKKRFINGEVLLINKPLNWTSFQVVKKIKSILYQKLAIKKIKIGHSGTLDPLAEGLLVICSGKMTKIMSEIQNYKKKTFKKNEFFHDYLKKEPREGRKMGHLTILKD